jgi:hypothetical protein
MGDHLGTRVVAGSNARCYRIPLGYGCPGCACFGDSLPRASTGWPITRPEPVLGGAFRSSLSPRSDTRHSSLWRYRLHPHEGAVIVPGRHVPFAQHRSRHRGRE